jgi:CheY-specific phosphatase CheX
MLVESLVKEVIAAFAELGAASAAKAAARLAKAVRNFFINPPKIHI